MKFFPVEDKAVYFLSDLHLGAPYLADSRLREKKVVSFLNSIKDDAEAIYLLGDILDYWYEYKYAVPRGYTRFFGKIAELSDNGVKIVWLIGNHDIWIKDYIPSELGVRVVDGSLIEEIQGKKLFLAHGDGVGKLDARFRFIRGIFRNKVCQWLYSGIHPRWTIPFAYNWSSHSRKEGEERGVPEESLLRNLTEFAISYHRDNPDIDFFIFGHVHVLTRRTIAPDCEMIILGEWIRTFSFARMQGSEIHLLKWD